jgi:hypothetical protein
MERGRSGRSGLARPGVGGHGVREPNELAEVVGGIRKHRVLTGSEDGDLLAFGHRMKVPQDFLAIDFTQAIAQFVQYENSADNVGVREESGEDQLDSEHLYLCTVSDFLIRNHPAASGSPPLWRHLPSPSSGAFWPHADNLKLRPVQAQPVQRLAHISENAFDVPFDHSLHVSRRPPPLSTSMRSSSIGLAASCPKRLDASPGDEVAVGMSVQACGEGAGDWGEGDGRRLMW